MPAKQAAAEAVQAAAPTIVGLSRRLHTLSETAWQEARSVEALVGVLSDAGFDVEQPAFKLDTAFVARAGSGPLRVGVMAEYDALPGLGHACGHNIIGAAAAGTGLALRPRLDDLGVELSIFGTPAEEGGGGKILMLDRGAFDRLHAAMMIHPGPYDVAEARPFAVAHDRVSYRGKAAHAGACPEDGVNASDAFTIAQVAIGLLRQQLPASVRVHGIVTRGGEAPNAIPERTEGRWYVRAASLDELDGFRQRVLRCFEAGALASGCELSVESESPPYAEFRNHPGLLARYVHNAQRLGRVFAEDEDARRVSRASTDMGNVSLRVPAIHPYIGIGSAPASNHQEAFAAHCVTATADRALLDGATAMAWTIVDAAADGPLREDLLSASAS